jgi:hypothetical protein
MLIIETATGLLQVPKLLSSNRTKIDEGHFLINLKSFFRWAGNSSFEVLFI